MILQKQPPSILFPCMIDKIIFNISNVLMFYYDYRISYVISTYCDKILASTVSNGLKFKALSKVISKRLSVYWIFFLNLTIMKIKILNIRMKQYWNLK